MIHRVPSLERGQAAVCVRCGACLERPGARRAAARRTAALACGAFFLYWPAMFLPILEIDRFGHHHASSLLGGTMELLAQGDWFVGLVILLFSIVFPLVKLVLLLELSWLSLLRGKHKAFTYRLMEGVGRWSMLDVMLLAFLVMLVKLGSLVQFHVGPAVVAFVGCVAMSMGASLTFDPHAIWEER